MSPLGQIPHHPPAIGVLLAGGEARRMGFDKRTQRLDGVTLLERNAAVLREVFPRLAISLRAGAPDALVPAGFEVVYDETSGTPLSGIASALARYDEPIFVLAADMAFAERAAVKEVLGAFADVDVALPVVNGHFEPLHAVYGPGCLAPIRAMLARGDHAIPHLYERVRLARVPFASAALFFNLNTPADLEEADRRLASQGRTDGARRPALVCAVGKSGSGKTTLLEALIPELRALGLRVGAVKHDAHQFDIDVPGKDPGGSDMPAPRPTWWTVRPSSPSWPTSRATRGSPTWSCASSQASTSSSSRVISCRPLARSRCSAAPPATTGRSASPARRWPW